MAKKYDGFHDDAKKLLGMMGKKKADQPKATKSKSSAVKKAEPTKVTANPAKKKAPVAAQPKKVPEKLRKASMEKPVAKAAPKAKAEGAKLKGYSQKSAETPRGFKAPVDKYPGKAAKIAKEMAEEAVFDNGLNKGGKAMKMAAELAPNATSKAEMAGIKGGIKNTIKKYAPKVVGAGMMGAVLGGPVGMGLTALMESLDASEANSGSHDKAAEAIAKRAAAKPKLQTKLPSEVKKTPQQRMEDDFAEELKKWPR